MRGDTEGYLTDRIERSLILVSIALVGGSVIYIYTSGFFNTFFGNNMVGQEKISIQVIYPDSKADTVCLYCKNIGGAEVKITDAILKDGSGEVIEVLSGLNDVLPNDGSMKMVYCSFEYDLQSGVQYSLILISQTGTQFTSQTFNA